MVSMIPVLMLEPTLGEKLLDMCAVIEITINLIIIR